VGSPHLTGTLDRAITGVRTLMGAAMEGAEPTDLRLAFDALRDQWWAAERDSRDDEAGSLRRFEDVAATIYGEAFWPAIKAVSEGRDPLEDLDRASEASRWILRAHTAFVSQHPEAMTLCFRRAANVVRDAEREPPAEA
jgi:hypothetical protein